MDSEHPLVIVCGPTGSGKSALAVELALALGGEVVNCDSLQFYRGMDIGTAKIPLAERRGVPHHLFDFLNPDQVFTAGEYARLATAALREIASRGRLPVLCGGSGFYIRALIDGLFPGPTRDDALRERFESAEGRRPGVIHRYLRRVDPAAANRIAPADVQKVVRAAEICWQARRPATELFSELGRAALTGFRACHLGLDPPREALYERINARSRHLFEMGLIEEVRDLLESGYPANSKAFESVGYRQAIDYLEGRSTFEQAVSDTAQKTRNYAKRQRTWFRKDPRIQWLAGFGGEQPIQAEAVAILQTNIFDGDGTFS